MPWLQLMALCIGLLMVPGVAHAEQVPVHKGLSITPAREYVTVTPGQSATKSIVVANTTDKPLQVSLSAGQFTVADYTYDYQFSAVRDDWIKLGQTQVELSPGKSQTIHYSIVPPATATPGGHYFTVFASADVLGGGTTKSQVRAASVVYMTVRGELRTTSTIQQVSVPGFTLGDIHFTLHAKNTGNTHFFAFVRGELQGLGVQSKAQEATHLLMPQTVRRVGGTIPAPLWPGIYTATYGYVTDAGDTVLRSSPVVYIPPWLLFVVGGVVLFAIFLIRRTQSRLPKGSSPQQYR